MLEEQRPQEQTPKLLKVFFVNPVAKPRMTQRDRWKKRECVNRYFAFKDAVNLQRHGFVMPEGNYHIVFYLPMPKSWSRTKKINCAGQRHQQKPDKDNLEKALLDALCENDQHIWDGRVTKLWWWEGKIEIYQYVTQSLKDFVMERIPS